MWRIVRGRGRDGRWREIHQVQVDSPSRGRVYEAVREVSDEPPPAPFVADLERETPVPGMDAIDDWGRQLDVAGVGGQDDQSIRFVEGTLDTLRRQTARLEWEGDGFAHAAHDPAAVVADLSDVVEIEVADDGGPASLSGQQTAEARMEWRRYTADGVAEGDAELEKHPTRIELNAEVGGEGERVTLVSRLVRVVGSKLTEPLKEPRDPFWKRRVWWAESRFSAAAREYPDISGVAMEDGRFRAFSEAGAEPVLVWVHGTIACCLPSLSQLGKLPVKIFRFEHDTFRSIRENAEDLLKAIHDYARHATSLVLVGHSRGGLVARYAAEHWARRLPGRPPTVLTFGTPHAGTPLATAGIRVFDAAVGGGQAAIDAIPTWDPISLATKLLLKSRVKWLPPPGIYEMQPKAGFIGALGVPPDLRAWGAAWKLGGSGKLRRRTRYAFDFAEGAFQGEPHDLVVATSSSLAVGRPQPVLDCNHFQYFGSPEVMDALSRLPI